MNDNPPVGTSEEAKEQEPGPSSPEANPEIEKFLNRKLTQEELQFITFVTQYYHLKGEIPTADLAYDQFGLPKKLYTECMKDELVVEALKERGIVFERIGTDWTSKSLTPLQLVAANTMMDLIDTRSQKKKLQDMGISTSMYNTWLRDPVFKNYLKERAESLLGDNQHEAHLALVDRVRSGDIRAITYYNEITGRYVKENTTASSTADLQSVITRIIEIIIDEVSNPQEVMIIAEKLKGLITARTIAGALVGDSEPIIQPQIISAPELNDDMLELVNSGEGF